MSYKPVLVLLLVALGLFANAQQTYKLDIKKSKILWNTRNTMGAHFGYLFFGSGSLDYSATGAPVAGAFSMDMNSIRSIDHTVAAENQKVDKEVRKPGFFDIDKYPAATITAKQITATAKINTFKVNADLTIKGITKPIEFTATIIKQGTMLTAKANLEIHRAYWNIDMQPQPITWNLFAAVKDKMIADEIVISLNLVFNQ